MTRRATVHFEPDDRAAAVRTARLVARLLHLSREHWNRETQFPRGATEAHLWLIPTTPATATEGGETRDANIYIFAPSAITKPIELLRTVAHEWGHLTLPAARGYAAPENDAAGYLGERLFLRWMTAPAQAQTAASEPYPGDPETRRALAQYAERQSSPLMARYADGGAMSPLLRGDTTEAMDYYVGMVLSCDAAFSIGGGDKVASLSGMMLWGVTGETAADFVRSAEREAAKQTPHGVTIALPAYVPLAKGEYALEAGSGVGVVTLSGLPSIKATLRAAARGQGAAILRVPKTGWYRVSAAPDSIASLRLIRKSP